MLAVQWPLYTDSLCIGHLFRAAVYGSAVHGPLYTGSPYTARRVYSGARSPYTSSLHIGPVVYGSPYTGSLHMGPLCTGSL